MPSIAELLLLRDRLQACSDTALLDVELLLAHCLQKNRTYLRTWPEAEVANDTEQQFLALLCRREQGEPIAHLLGERGFWSLDLQVNASTLIPRPETELLVEQVLALLTDCPQLSVLDLGTGTGAIALALAQEKPDWKILACDREPAAVQLAEANRRALGLDNVSIFQSNWFAAVAPQRFELIVSNPPYIDGDDPHLTQGDLRFEPRSALVAANKGLADIEHIIAHSQDYLQPGGWLLLEHGYNQRRAVRECFEQSGFINVFSRQDLAGMDRITGGQCRA